MARVTLDRPEVHNAFNASVIAELRTTFAGLAREGPTELRAVVLAGAGPSFCAGADVAWMRAAMELDVEGNEQDAMAMADMFEAIDTCPVPVIAQGPRVSAGRRHGAVRGVGPRDRRVRDPLRLHRDAAGHPAGGHLAVRHREDRGEPRTRAVPGRPPVRRDPRAADRARPRGGRGRGRRWTPPSRRRFATCSPRARPLSGPRKRSSAKCAASATDRRSGTRRASSPASATSAEAQEGFRAFDEKRAPSWAPEEDAS